MTINSGSETIQNGYWYILTYYDMSMVIKLDMYLKRRLAVVYLAYVSTILITNIQATKH